MKLINLLIPLIILSLYCFVIPSGLVLGEGPLLTASSHLLGIGHPPGYPLYHMVAKSWFMIPLGTLVYRFHLLSLVIGFAVLIQFLALSRLISQSSGWFGVSILVLTPTFMFSLTKGEVYAFTLFLFEVILYSFLSWTIRDDTRWLYLCAFLIGLSLCHHLTLVLTLPALCLLLLYSGKLDIRLFSFSLISFISGCSVWLYLPIRAGGGAMINWGDPATVNQFVTLITASEEAMPSILDTFRQHSFSSLTQQVLSLFQADFSPGILVMALIGMVALLGFNRNQAFIIFFVFLTFLLAVVIYQSNESTYFFLPATLLVMLCCEFAFARIYDWSRSGSHDSRGIKRMFSPRTVAVLSLVAVIIVTQVIAFIPHLPAGVHAFDLELFSRGLITGTGDQGYLCTSMSSLYFLMLYQQYVEQMGTEVYPVFYHLLSFPWFLKLFPGELPLEQGDEVIGLAEDSREWNMAISLALLNRAYRSSNASVVELGYYGELRKLFPSIPIHSRGFMFHLTDPSCAQTRFSSSAYEQFVSYTSSQSLSATNNEMYAYLHRLHSIVQQRNSCSTQAVVERNLASYFNGLSRGNPSAGKILIPWIKPGHQEDQAR